MVGNLLLNMENMCASFTAGIILNPRALMLSPRSGPSHWCSVWSVPPFLYPRDNHGALDAAAANKRGEPGEMDAAYAANDTGRTGVRWALGLLLAGGGIALLAVGVGAAPSDSGSHTESRVIFIGMGVLLVASGMQAGQWVAMGSRFSYALGRPAITSMAVLFGWVAIYGEAAGFSGGISIAGATVTAGGSVTPARIAFGIASIAFGLASLWAWKQVLRHRG